MSNSSIDAIDVHRMMRAAVTRSGSQAAWGRKHGMSRQQVAQVLSGQCQPSKTILDEIGVRVRTVRIYEMVGDAT